MNKTNPIRAVNEGPQSEVAQHRRDVYAKCIDKYNEAISSHYFIEAVAIVESLIADRLESRKAVFVGNEDENRFDTIGSLINYLDKNESDQDLKKAYEKVKKWSKRRNSAVHRLAKIEKDNLVEWDLKYDQIKGVANDGFELFKTLSKIIQPLNKAFRASSSGPNKK